MDIGSEISEKIQLAIKAKLIEINAYVDDELPDYIMIMIANRKPEEQMSDALSLFLNTNAKSFTKWLYELLGSLRKKTTEKNEESPPTKKSSELKEKSNNESEEKLAADELSPVMKPVPPVKSSRWDVKKPVKKKNGTNTSNEIIEKDVVETKETIPVSNEAVIDILPEKDDLFDEELLGNSKETPVRSTKTSPKSRKVEISVIKLDANVASCDSENDKHKILPSTKKQTSLKSFEKKGKIVIDSSKNAKLTSSVSESNKKDSSVSHQKRSIVLKSSKDSNRKVSTTDKEFSYQFAPPKPKKKKLKRPRERESSSNARDKEKSSQRHVREWDLAKGRESLTYDDLPSKKSSHSDKVERVSVKSRISLVSSAVSIAKDAQYESEDSDASPVRSSVISKVAVPKRRSRLHPSKQANRSLLLKAVSDAESSIKRFLANKPIKPVSEKAFKSKVEKHKRTALGNVLEEKHKRTALGNVLEKNKIQDQESSRKQVSSRLLRESNLLRPSTESLNAKKASTKQSPKKRKSQTDEADKPEAPKADAPHVFGDSRRIVPRDRSEPVKGKKLIRRRPAVENVATSQDKRKLSMKNSSEIGEALDEKNDENMLQESSNDEVEEADKPPKRSRKQRSNSPCFIVTLDGSSASNAKEEKTPKKRSNSTDKAIKLKSTSNESPEASSTRTADSLIEEVETKPNLSEKSKSVGDDTTLSELELDNMREKLLAMQEKAKKLKEIQTKRQELLQQKINHEQTASNAGDKIIHVANVHFSATESQLSEHFSICGKVTKATILKDTYGHPKGFAYIEFEEEKAVKVALAFDGTSFCGRIVNISHKPNELATVSASASKRFYSTKRYSSSNPRQFKRYSARVPSRTWTRAPVTRNKTWVKPGYTPS